MIVSELQFINAFFAFCTATGGAWPNSLQALGYQVVGVEREVTVSGATRDRTVVPDIICGSGHLSHVLCVDAKSRTVDGDQERAYMAMESESLFAQGVIAPGTVRSMLSHDSALATSESYLNALVANMERESVELPVICADHRQFKLGFGEVREQALAKVLGEGVEIADRDWPMKFVKFTSKSTDAEMVPIIGRALMESIRNGGKFSVDSIIERSISHWHLVGQRERRALRRKVTILIDAGCSEELTQYYRRDMPAQQWTVTKQVANKANALEALNLRAGEFVRRHELGIPFHKDQPNLFGGELLEHEEEP